MICEFICKTPCTDEPCMIRVPLSINNCPAFPDCCPFDKTIQVKFSPATKEDSAKWEAQFCDDNDAASVADLEAVESRRSCREIH